ncbi:J domain-containing protein [candidate division KSB1 bacterium]|nr:J domain-containing protein [candidate division KSB1 bacterium]
MDLAARLYQIAKAFTNSTLEELLRKAEKRQRISGHTQFNDHKSTSRQSQAAKRTAVDPALAEYYANLEIPYGSDLNSAKAAWKQLLKKYHPDVHSLDPEKRNIATQLTQKLNEAYRAIEKAISENKI